MSGFSWLTGSTETDEQKKARKAQEQAAFVAAQTRDRDSALRQIRGLLPRLLAEVNANSDSWNEHNTGQIAGLLHSLRASIEYLLVAKDNLYNRGEWARDKRAENAAEMKELDILTKKWRLLQMERDRLV